MAYGWQAANYILRPNFFEMNSSNGTNRESFDIGNGRKRSQTTNGNSNALQSFFNGTSASQAQPNTSSSINNTTRHSTIPANQNISNFTANSASGARTMGLRKSLSQEKPFVSLYERTLSLISRLYSVPDFEYYLFPGGINSLLVGDASPVIDPISILWNCFRLGIILYQFIHH